eukprot:1146828-Pelagomonas_calceolata.AAC.2
MCPVTFMCRDDDKKAWVAVVVGAGAALIATPYAMWLRKKMMSEDAEIHQENMEKDAEAAHVAAGGTAKEKVEVVKEPTKAEQWLEWFNGTWFGQRAWVKGEFLMHDICQECANSSVLGYVCHPVELLICAFMFQTLILTQPGECANIHVLCKEDKSQFSVCYCMKKITYEKNEPKQSIHYLVCCYIHVQCKVRKDLISNEQIMSTLVYLLLPADFISAMTYDVHAHVATLDDPRVAKLHADAEVFDPRTEDVFKHMQVITACGVAFVHGANDVANGVGPLAGIWQVYTNHKVSEGVKASQPRWILVIGAFGIVFGLAMYGYRIIA